MQTNFITTEDRHNNLYKINISQIILIEDFDNEKYFRQITLNEKMPDGLNRKIDSIDSLKELEDKISNAQQ